VSAVSGFAGRFFAQSTLRDKNLTAAAAAKTIIKVKLKKRINFANFLTFPDYHAMNTVSSTILLTKKSFRYKLLSEIINI